MVRPILLTWLGYCCLILTGTNLTACTDSTSTPARSWSINQQISYTARLTRDNKQLLHATLEHGVMVWDIEQQQLRYHWQHSRASQEPIYLLKLSQDDQFAVTATQSQVALWRLSDGASIGLWQITEGKIRDIAVSNAGKRILVAKDNNKIEAFSPATQQRHQFNGHLAQINSIDISADGQYALSAGNDYLAYLWHSYSGEIKHRFVHNARINKVKIAQTVDRLVTSDSQDTSYIWQLTSGEKLSQLNTTKLTSLFYSIKFNQDASLLLTSGSDRALTLWQTATGEPIQHWQITRTKDKAILGAVVYDANFAQLGDNTYIQSVSSNNRLEYWPITDMTQAAAKSAQLNAFQ